MFGGGNVLKLFSTLKLLKDVYFVPCGRQWNEKQTFLLCIYVMIHVCGNRGCNEICPAAEIQIARFVKNAHKNGKSAFKKPSVYSLQFNQLYQPIINLPQQQGAFSISQSINKLTSHPFPPPRVQAKRANLSSSHKGKPKYCNGCRTLGALTDQTAPKLNPLSFGAGGT